MPRSQRLETYPVKEYWALFARVIATNEPFTIPCTRGQALTMRAKLYAFRKALMTEREVAMALSLDPEAAQAVALRIVEDGLQALPHSYLAEPKLIMAALGGGQAPNPASEAAAKALENLRQAMPEALPTTPDPVKDPYGILR